MTKQIIKQDCGCINEHTTRRKGHMSYTTIKQIKLCKEHKKEINKKNKEIEKFNKFPNKKSKKIYNILDNMIDDIYNDGVDVSYFPEEAKKTLKQYAIKIEKLK